MKARWADPEKGEQQKASIAEGAKRAKIGEATKARWADPEMRAKMLAGMRTTTKRLGRPPRAG